MNNDEINQELTDTLKRLNENFISKYNECSLLYRKIEALEAKVKELKSDKEFLSRTVDERSTLISECQGYKAEISHLNMSLGIEKAHTKRLEKDFKDTLGNVEYWRKRCETLESEKNGGRTTLEQYAHEVAESMKVSDDTAWKILSALSRNYKAPDNPKPETLSGDGLLEYKRF